MPTSKSPAFQFYPKDFLTDENVAVMSSAARGAYMMLLCHCWLQGSLPSDRDKLLALSGVVLEDWDGLWSEIEPCFRSNGNGRLTHPRLDRERRKQRSYSKMKAEAGKKGAAKRWNKSKLDGSATPVPMAEGMANDSPPSPTPTTSTTPTESPAPLAHAQRDRVQRVLDIYPAVKPGMAAKWLKSWADDDALLSALRECSEIGYLIKPPPYVHQVLESARKDGGKVRGGVRARGAPPNRLSAADARVPSSELRRAHEAGECGGPEICNACYLEQEQAK